MTQKASKTKTEDDYDDNNDYDSNDMEDNEAYGDKTYTGIVRSQVQTPLNSWIFQASLRNCKHCIHICEDQSLFDFTSPVQYMLHFI